jgi:hypothetical protein
MLELGAPRLGSCFFLLCFSIAVASWAAISAVRGECGAPLVRVDGGENSFDRRTLRPDEALCSPFPHPQRRALRGTLGPRCPRRRDASARFRSAGGVAGIGSSSLFVRVGRCRRSRRFLQGDTLPPWFVFGLAIFPSDDSVLSPRAGRSWPRARWRAGSPSPRRHRNRWWPRKKISAPRPSSGEPVERAR